MISSSPERVRMTHTAGSNGISRSALTAKLTPTGTAPTSETATRGRAMAVEPTAGLGLATTGSESDEPAPTWHEHRHIEF